MKSSHSATAVLRFVSSGFKASLFALPLMSLGGAGVARAEEVPDEYFQIDSVQLRRTDAGSGAWQEVMPYNRKSDLRVLHPSARMNTAAAPALDPKTIANIINIGKEAWKVIEANKPVVNIKTDIAFALPKGVTDLNELDSWKGPATATYQVVYTNKFGMDVVKLEYTLSFEHHGRQNGNGLYIANATVIPQSVKVMWGFTFDADMSVTAVTNQGTKDEPLAALGLLFHWTVKNPIQHNEETAAFTVRGDGSIQVQR